MGVERRSDAMSRRGSVFSALLISTLMIVPAGLADVQGRSIADNEPTTPIIVLERVEHDHQAFTQGFLIWNHTLYESTGLYNHSTLREVDLNDGSILRSIDLPDDEFAEGLALVNETLYVLTWKAGIVHRYDRSTFAELGDLTYEGEGWGLCWDGEHLAMSNGSSSIAFRNPNTFAIERTIEVTLNGSPISNLNELECVGNRILANVWFDDVILDIDKDTGNVSMALDASNLLTSEEEQDANVLNGIAWNHDTSDLWITGKLWPAMFRIEWSGSEHWPEGEAPDTIPSLDNSNDSKSNNESDQANNVNLTASNDSESQLNESSNIIQSDGNLSDCSEGANICDAWCKRDGADVAEGCPTPTCDCKEEHAAERDAPLSSGVIIAILGAAVLNRGGMPRSRSRGKA
ncbi:MAG: hypothetical protein CL992_03820 [Euryarchaeota archaeon]|nr:hypothetical protein [Euryarchaeota archaeon]